MARLPEPEVAEEPAGIRLAVIGRPNVGKSSLVNALLGEERVVVSDEPGTTRDAVDSVLQRDGERYVLVDTAGIRRPSRRRSQAERGGALMALRSLERADVALVVIDAEEGVTDQDVRVAGDRARSFRREPVVERVQDRRPKGMPASECAVRPGWFWHRGTNSPAFGS